LTSQSTQIFSNKSEFENDGTCVVFDFSPGRGVVCVAGRCMYQGGE